MMFAPLEGWRHVKVTDRHTAVDYAHVLKEISDIYFGRRSDHVAAGQPEHPRQVVTLPSLPATEARRLVQRFEWVYTPKHGSWLDLAESELAVLSRQCLDRRIPASKRSNGRSPPGSNTAISTTRRPTGASQPRPTPCFR